MDDAFLSRLDGSEGGGRGGSGGDGPHESWRCVIYWFLVKFSDEKSGYSPTDQPMDRPTDRPTDQPTDQSTDQPTDRRAHPLIEMRVASKNGIHKPMSIFVITL